MLETFLSIVTFLVYLLEAIGIIVIFGGFITAFVVYLSQFSVMTTHEAYIAFRRRSVRGLILGLEFLVAADIIKTITVDYSLHSVLMLGMIIVLRTFLVFALHLEVDGHLPWQKRRKADDQEAV